MKRVRLIQNNPFSHFAVYIVDNIFDEEYRYQMLNTVKEITEKDKMNKSTNVKASMSTWFELFEYELFQRFFTEAIEHAQTFYSLRACIPNESFDYTLIDAWAMKHSKGDYTLMHTHGPSTWSGAYYLQIPEQTYMTFPDFNHVEPLQENSLYLFHSLIKHEVGVQQYEDPRYSIAFNIKQDFIKNE